MTTVLFAERFKAAREKSGLTLKELKDRIGVSVSALSHYANGANLPPLDVAAKLATELGVSLDWLCGIEKDEPTTLRDCADAAIMLEKVRDMFQSSTITIDEEEVPNPNPYSFETNIFYYAQLTINSEILYRYFQQLKATEDYAKSLPEETKAGFAPFMETMRESLLAHVRKVSGPSTGLKKYFISETDELPF